MSVATIMAPVARPLLRGWSHLIAFFAAVIGTVALAIRVPDHGTRTLALIYGASLASLLGISALYHSVTWSRAARRIFKPLDHSAIFVLIAGSATPFSHALHASTARWLLAVSWSAAALGVARAIFWPRAPKKLIALQSVVTGWLALCFLPALAAALDTATLGLTLLGGFLYTVGAAIFAFRWPNPWPRVFGFHEIFHLLVIAGAAAHFAAVWRVLGA